MDYDPDVGMSGEVAYHADCRSNDTSAAKVLYFFMGYDASSNPPDSKGALKRDRIKPYPSAKATGAGITRGTSEATTPQCEAPEHGEAGLPENSTRGSHLPTNHDSCADDRKAVMTPWYR